MSETLVLKGLEECELFIEGNYDPQWGELWVNISHELEDSYKNIQTNEVISQRTSDGRYFKGYYDWHHSEGWFPFDNREDIKMELTEVFPLYTVIQTFEDEPIVDDAPQENISELTSELISAVWTMIDEYAINKDGGEEYDAVVELMDKLSEVIKE